MICISCKKNIVADAVFCPYCGKKQSKAAVGYHRRGNGLGSVYKMPAGTWAAEVTLGYIVKDGRCKRKRRRKYGFKTKKEAVQYLERLRADELLVGKCPTFSELWERFAPELDSLSKSKQTAYRIAWGRIAPEIGHRQIDDVKTAELQDVAAVVDTYYPRRDIRTVLSHLYKIAMRDDFVSQNRAQFIILPKLEASEREIFTAAEIELLWADYKKSGDKVTAVLLTMLYTGMRPAEVLGVLVENVDLSGHYLTGGLKTEKGRNRKIIIPDRLQPVIRAALAAPRDGRLFWYSHKTDFYDAWIEKRTALGMREELVPYCARHTYITRLTALGVSPAMLQELAGHEDYETTLNYTHLSVDDRLAAVNML